MRITRKAPPILVTRYERSRLYEAAMGRYVSIEQLRAWVAEGRELLVIDDETGMDITRVLLA